MQTLPGNQQGTSSSIVVSNETQQARGLLRAFVALRHRNFRLFWFGQLISLIGTWMQTTAQSWLVLELTHSAWWLGLVGALQFLPVMFFALFGGVLADRLPKRTVLIFTQSSAMIQAFILWLLVATGEVRIWQVLILALMLGITNALDMPTRQAFVVEMVGRSDLPNAISFIAVIIGLAMIDLRQLHLHPGNLKAVVGGAIAKPRTWESLREGLVYSWRTPSILLIIAVMGVISLFGINFNVVLPLFATEVLNVGAIGFGFISSAFGVGSLIAALWLAWGNNRPSISQLLTGATAFCIFEALFAISHWYLLSLALIAVVGFAQIVFSALSNTTLQTVAPDHLRGRVMSAYMLVFAGTTPLGNLFTGGLAHFLGSPIALLIDALISLAAAIGGWIYRKPAEKSLAEANLLAD